MIARALALWILVALAIPTQVGGADTSPSKRPQTVRVAGATAGLSFRVAFPAPEFKEIEFEGESFRFLEWAGVPAEGEAGAPAIPTHLVRVAVPASGPVTLEVQTEPRSSARGVRFPPVPSRVPVERQPGSRTEPVPQYTLKYAHERFAKIKSPPSAELVSLSVERGLRVAIVAVRPVVWDAETESATWAQSVSFTLHTQPGSRDPGRRARPDRAGDVVGATSLLNPEDIPFYRAVDDTLPDPPLGGIPDVWFDDAAGWVKVYVGANGIHRLSRTALSDAGVPVATVDPRTLRLYAGSLVPHIGTGFVGWETVASGFVTEVVPIWQHVYEQPGFADGFAGGFSQVALWVRGEDDGTLDGADDVLFYGLKPDNFRDRFGLPAEAMEDYFVNPYSNETVYWLTWGSGLPGTPLRMAAADASPQPGAEVVTQSRVRHHEEKNSIYDPSLYLGGYRWDRWFWEYIEESGQGIDVALPHAVPGTTLDAHVRMWGSRIPDNAAVGEAAFHHVKVDINNQDIGTFIWGGTQAREAITPQDVIATDIPISNPSRFELRVLPVPGSRPERLDQAELAWIDITYTRELHLDGNAGELEIDPGAAGRTLRFTQPPSAPLVFDVGDPRHPRRLTGAVVAGGNLEMAYDGAAATVVAATNEGSLRSPVRLVPDTPPRTEPDGGLVRWLRDTSEPIDYLIIAHDDLATEGEILARWRRDHLYPFTPGRQARVRVVRVSDIMDEFAWGMWDPAALRFFLEYAYRHYGTLNDDPLSYALFLGDTTYDPKNYDRTAVPDQMPTWLDNRDGIGAIGDGNVQYSSDDPLARFDARMPVSGRSDGITKGSLDNVTDLFIGRIVARTPAVARRVIEDKIIRSESAPDYGAWRTKAILVADDVCQAQKVDRLGFIHMSQMEQVTATMPPDFDVDKIYLYEYGEECDVSAKPDAKRALLDSWGEGAWLVNYIGHGGAPVWADEHVLDVTDSPALANAGRLPVMGAFSCSVGKFASPHVVSIGEALLLAEGGALVSAAATHLTGSNTNSTFNRRFLEFMFPSGPVTDVPIGVALMQAKRLVTGQSLKYVCLGDPASALSIPDLNLDLTGPATLERGSAPSLRVELPGGLGRDGRVDVLARDAAFVRTTNSRGETFCEHAARLGIACASGVRDGYRQTGSLIFEGQGPLTADTAQVQFTVPVSLRGGPDGKIRVYAWGDGWDAMGSLSGLAVTGDGQNPAFPDSVGPQISYSVAQGNVLPGQQIQVTLEDASGINLTELFEFRSIVLKVLDDRGLEQLRENLTPRFRYDEGSHTRGTVPFAVPDLPEGDYTFSVSAFDNYNYRTVETTTYSLGLSAGGAGFTGVAAYPNPFNPESQPTQVLFQIPQASSVEIRIYSVAGRLVKKDLVEATAGRNAYLWDGRDAVSDPVGNGVYLVQLKRVGDDNSGDQKHLERVLVIR